MILLAILLLSTAAQAALIDVQIVSPGGDAAHGTAGAQFSGQALIGSAGDQWNQVRSASGLAALATSTGVSSGLSLNYSSSVVYGLAPGQQQFLNTPYANLMQSFLVSHNGEAPMTMTFNGLAAGQAFDLYMYGQSASSSYGETVNVNGVVQTALQSNASSFVANDNYLLFHGIADAADTILISDVTAPGRMEADLNGLQLVTTQVPEPLSVTLFGFGLVCLAGVRRYCQTAN